jgi:hypothetical protein
MDETEQARNVLHETLIVVEQIDDENRARYEAIYQEEESGVKVRPLFVATGE